MDVKTKENFSSLGKKSQEQDGKEISKLSQDLVIRLKLNHPLNDFHVGRLFFAFVLFLFLILLEDIFHGNIFLAINRKSW